MEWALEGTTMRAQGRFSQILGLPFLPSGQLFADSC
jgi:hypothetical protein